MLPDIVRAFAVSFELRPGTAPMEAVAKSIGAQSTKTIKADIVPHAEERIVTHHWIGEAFGDPDVCSRLGYLNLFCIIQVAIHLDTTCREISL